MTLKQRLDALVDMIAEKMNWLLTKKEDLSNKKGYLNSTNADFYPNIPAVNQGLADLLIEGNDYTDSQIDIVDLALDDKVDRVSGMGLSANDFSNALKIKLEDIEGTKYKGAYPDLATLKTAFPEGANPSPNWHHDEGGWYADVGVQGSDDIRYTWDPNDYVWIESGLAGLTPEQVRQLYLQNADTNNFDDDAKKKLGGIEAGAQKNVQSNWTQNNSTKDDFIKNKITKLGQLQNDKDFVSGQWVIDQGYLAQAFFNYFVDTLGGMAYEDSADWQKKLIASTNIQINQSTRKISATDTKYSVFTDAENGLVPKPKPTEKDGFFLNGLGEWVEISDALNDDKLVKIAIPIEELPVSYGLEDIATWLNTEEVVIGEGEIIAWVVTKGVQVDVSMKEPNSRSTYFNDEPIGVLLNIQYDDDDIYELRGFISGLGMGTYDNLTTGNLFVVGGKPEDYPDYAQQLVDGLNF